MKFMQSQKMNYFLLLFLFSSSISLIQGMEEKKLILFDALYKKYSETVTNINKELKKQREISIQIEKDPENTDLLAQQAKISSELDKDRCILSLLKKFGIPPSGGSDFFSLSNDKEQASNKENKKIDKG